MSKITGKMLKEMIEKMMSVDLPEQQPLPVEKLEIKSVLPPIKAERIADLPKAWEDDDRNVLFDGEAFDWRSEEEIFTDQVRFKWKAFKKTLSQREQAILRSLLGFDVKRYSVAELQNLQGALKGKGTK